MPRRALPGAALLLVLLACAAHAQTVASVQFEGLARINRTGLEGLVRTKVGTAFSDDTARDDLARIVSLGFFNPDKCSYNRTNRAEGVDIIFRLAENPAITSIAIRGATIAEVGEVKIREAAEARFRVGEVYNLNTGPKLAEDVARLYDAAGFEGTIQPPLIGEDGALVIVVAETRIEDVVLNVWPPTDALDLGKLVEWVGMRIGSPLSKAQLGDRQSALMGLGLFAYLAIDLLDGQTGVVVRLSGVLNDYPVPSPEAMAFVDPGKLLTGLAVYRIAPPPYGLISEPRPTPKWIAALVAKSQAAPQDGAAAAKVALALARAGRVEESLSAATAARALLASATDPASRVLTARLMLLAGEAEPAWTLLSAMRNAGELSPEGYPTLIEAAVTLLADSIVTDPAAARRPGDSLAWALRALIGCPDPTAALASQRGVEYSSALGGAWTAFSRLDEAGIAREHAAFERVLRIFALLEYLPTELAPSTVVPACGEDLRRPVDPVYENPRLLAGLERGGEDPTTRGAWAMAVLQRELATTVGAGDAGPTAGEDKRPAELARAITILEELVATEPERWSGARGLLGLGYVVQKEDEKGLTLIASLLDGDDVPDADHIYLLAASMTTTRGVEDQRELEAAMVAAANRLTPLIATGGPHPRARYARCSLLAWAGDLERAVEEARAETAGSPSDAPMWAALGFFEGQKTNWDAAEQALAKSLELDPSDRAAQYALGLVRWARTGDGAANLPMLSALRDDSPVDRAARDLAF